MHNNVWGWTEVLSKEELLNATISVNSLPYQVLGGYSSNYDQILEIVKKNPTTYSLVVSAIFDFNKRRSEVTKGKIFVESQP